MVSAVESQARKDTASLRTTLTNVSRQSLHMPDRGASSGRGPWPQGAHASVKEARLSGVGIKSTHPNKEGERLGKERQEEEEQKRLKEEGREQESESEGRN